MRAGTVILFTSALLLTFPASAATIMGRIRESRSGEVMPGATVTLTGGAVTGSRTVVANEQGGYHFIGVPAGAQYELKAELPGLSPWAMRIDYLYQDDRVTADLPVDVVIMECSLGRNTQIPMTFAAPGTFRIRASDMRYLP